MNGFIANIEDLTESKRLARGRQGDAPAIREEARKLLDRIALLKK